LSPKKFVFTLPDPNLFPIMIFAFQERKIIKLT
jgi:hypothetical protein